MSARPMPRLVRRRRIDTPRGAFYNSLSFNADVAQRQSTAFVKRGLWVQIPPSALLLNSRETVFFCIFSTFFSQSVRFRDLVPVLPPVCAQLLKTKRVRVSARNPNNFVERKHR